MPANLENSAVATGLERVSFHSSPKERQYQRMFKLLHNCTHLTRQQSNAQNFPSEASTVCVFIYILSHTLLSIYLQILFQILFHHRCLKILSVLSCAPQQDLVACFIHSSVYVFLKRKLLTIICFTVCVTFYCVCAQSLSWV